MAHEVQREDIGVGFDTSHTRKRPSIACRNEMASRTREAMAPDGIPQTVTFHKEQPPTGPHVSTATIQSDDNDQSNKWQNTWPQERPPRRGGGNSIRATLATQQAISLAKVSELQKQLAILEEKLKELHAVSELDEANVINRLCSDYSRENPKNNEAEPRAASPMPSFYCISQGVNEAHSVNERRLGSHIVPAGATDSRFVPMRDDVVTSDTATSSRIKPKRPGWAHRVMSEPTGYENPLSETIDVLSSSSGMQEINSQLTKLFNGDQSTGVEVNSESTNSSLYCWAPNQASTCNSNMGLDEPTCSTDPIAHPIIQSQVHHSSDFHSYPVTITSTDFSREFGEDIWEFDTCDFTYESKDTSCHSSVESLPGNRINPISESSPHPQVNGTTKRVIMGHGDLVEVKVDSHKTLSVENWSMDANSDGRGESSLLSSSSGLSGDYSMKTSQCNSQGSGSNDDRPGTSCTHAPLRRNTGSSGSMNRARSVTPLLKRRKQSPMNITLSSEGDYGSDVEAAPPLSSPRSEDRKSPHQIIKSALKTTAKAMHKSPKKADHDLDEIDMQTVRYKPEALDKLCKMTKFSKKELQLMYRGFKQECPSGMVNEDTFKTIYAQFFPQGDSSHYAHYVFNSFDTDHNGSLTFEEFVQGLSILARGSLQEKLNWAFNLYDINRDGYITREEMLNIVQAIYDMMGKYSEPTVEDISPVEHVERVFQKMDMNRDGVVSMDEFIDSCKRDDNIKKSMHVFDTIL